MAIQAITINRADAGGRNIPLLNVCGYLAEKKYGSGANAIRQLAEASPEYQETLDDPEYQETIALMESGKKRRGSG